MAASLLVSVGLLAGCGGEPEFEWPDDPTPEPRPTLDSAEAEATEELLARFDDFRRAEIGWQADPEPAHLAQHQLSDYLADPLLASTLFELELMNERGLIRQGEPTWAPTVTELSLDATPPTATIRDCWDTTGWQLAQRGSGEPADSAGLPARYGPDRHLMEFTASFIDDQWLFAEARVEGGAQC